jgi:antitoxin component YwqK of YwqJK toxin-antitoxin module
MTTIHLTDSTLVEEKGLDKDIHMNQAQAQDQVQDHAITDDIVQNETLDRIKKTYASYISDPKCVYKLCDDRLRDNRICNNRPCDDRLYDDNQWIIILQKLPSTRTNAGRSNIKNQKYAKHRANVLKVLKIININDERTIDKLDHTIKMRSKQDYKMITKQITYIVGENVVPDSFDEDSNVVCTNGIHYFESIDRAFLYRDGGIPCDYTGTWITWQDNGLKRTKFTYNHGNQKGMCMWFDNGYKNQEGEILNGTKHGIWTHWYGNGNKESEGMYLNDSRDGIWTYWFYNGIKESEGRFLDDLKDGIWTYWSNDGIKIKEWLHK